MDNLKQEKTCIPFDFVIEGVTWNSGQTKKAPWPSTGLFKNP